MLIKSQLDIVKVHWFLTGVSAASSLFCFLPASRAEFQEAEVQGRLTWLSGAQEYLLSCHVSLLSKLRESGWPPEEPVCLMIQDTWV